MQGDEAICFLSDRIVQENVSGEMLRCFEIQSEYAVSPDTKSNLDQKEPR